MGCKGKRGRCRRIIINSSSSIRQLQEELEKDELLLNSLPSLICLFCPVISTVQLPIAFLHHSRTHHTHPHTNATKHEHCSTRTTFLMMPHWNLGVMICLWTEGERVDFFALTARPSSSSHQLHFLISDLIPDLWVSDWCAGICRISQWYQPVGACFSQSTSLKYK